jgi:hypothetical protein
MSTACLLNSFHLPFLIRLVFTFDPFISSFALKKFYKKSLQCQTPAARPGKLQIPEFSQVRHNPLKDPIIAGRSSAKANSSH